MDVAEAERVSALLAAEANAVGLFDEVVARGIIAPGARESVVSDPAKLALRDALEPFWEQGRAYFDAHPDITGDQLYTWVAEQAAAQGWELTAAIAGHLVGEFPHKQISGTELTSYVAAGSTPPMRRLDPKGRVCHWILEIHLVDRANNIGGFFEQLLDIRPAA
ncbi:hypothetical protein ACIBCN_41815 [Nocardia sp. NPDC051052]|uniref:hypothetical protein n=1 Tax=Nocardia sp. NPDC051052 TaxID=3364322 RepID=UPI0037B36548